MHEGRLEEIKAEALSDKNWVSESDLVILELVAEVECLRGRLEAVCDVVSDACAFGDDVPALRVMEAVRGYRTATLEEVRKRISSVPIEVLMRWIETGQADIKAEDGLRDEEGYSYSRAATLSEVRARFVGVPDGLLEKWIADGKARVGADGVLKVDDLTGLSGELWNWK